MLPHLVAHGTFMDGLWYDTIARNLAIGMGSFWRPMFTPTISPGFFADHPPLVFAIESVFFRVFGDHWWVGKLYGFATLVASGALIVALWRAGGASKRLAWLPVLFWIATPLVGWSFSNEMLENTMGLFQLGASWAFVEASTRKGSRGDLLSVLAGALLFAAILCKGVVAPFPLALPFLLSGVLGRGTPREAFVRAFLAAATIFLLGWLAWQIPEARGYAVRYLESNFLPLASGKRGGVDNRLHIVWKLFLELLPMLVLAAAIAWAGRKRALSGDMRMGFALVATGLAGSLPLVMSPIQSGFYLVPSFPFFALGLALLVAPRAEALSARLAPFERELTIGCAILLVAALGYSATRVGTIGRGGPTIDDVRAIGKVVPRGATVSVCPATYRSWALHGYFMLYDRVTLDANSISHEWFVVEEGACDPPPWYIPVESPTAKLKLYRAP